MALHVLVIFNPDDDLLSTVIVPGHEVESAAKQIQELDPDCRIEEYVAETLEDTLEYLRENQ